MEAWFSMEFAHLLQFVSLPQVGLPALFLVAFVSATLVPMGSEPALLALVAVEPSMLWPGIAVASLGNTLGGAVTWAMGFYAERAYVGTVRRVAHHEPRGLGSARARAWLQRHGAMACALSWLPVVGDPLCAVAGWMRLPFWSCLGWMALGKTARYLTITVLAAWLAPQWFR